MIVRIDSDCSKLPCPVCGARVLPERGVYEICPTCGWEDDPVQSDDLDYAGGANAVSLRDAQLRWRERWGKSES